MENNATSQAPSADSSKVSAAPTGEFHYDRPVQLRIACMSLRHKLMYVDARHAQRGVTDDSSRTRIFWCSKTQDVLGPDGENVSPTNCMATRSCYCGS